MATLEKNPKITVAVPTYNREAVLFDTISDILSQSLQEFEIIIVDQTDRPTKAYMAKIEKLKSDQRFRYFHVTPASVTTARNFALAQCRSEIIVYLDDDVRFGKTFLQSYLHAFAKHPDVSAIGGRVMQEGFPIYDDILKFNELMISEGVFTSPKSGYTNAFAGGNCALKVADALSVGGFDTRYRGNSFREESDMAIKMVKAGMKILYEPKAELLHLSAPSGGNRVRGDIWDNPETYVNEIFFTLRHAAKGRKLEALKTKYETFTDVPSRRLALRRRRYFLQGVLKAVARLILMPQRKAVEYS